MVQILNRVFVDKFSIFFVIPYEPFHSIFIAFSSILRRFPIFNLQMKVLVAFSFFLCNRYTVIQLNSLPINIRFWIRFDNATLNAILQRMTTALGLKFMRSSANWTIKTYRLWI